MPDSNINSFLLHLLHCSFQSRISNVAPGSRNVTDDINFDALFAHGHRFKTSQLGAAKGSFRQAQIITDPGVHVENCNAKVRPLKLQSPQGVKKNLSTVFLHIFPLIFEFAKKKKLSLLFASWMALSTCCMSCLMFCSSWQLDRLVVGPYGMSVPLDHQHLHFLRLGSSQGVQVSSEESKIFGLLLPVILLKHAETLSVCRSIYLSTLDSEIGRQIDRQTDRQTERQIDR